MGPTPAEELPWGQLPPKRWGQNNPLKTEELAALVDDRPGKLFKLMTALGFVAGALTASLRRACARVLDQHFPAKPLKLLPREQLVVEVRRHPAVLLPASAVTASGWVAAMAAQTVLPPSSGHLLWLAWLVTYAWLCWLTTKWWHERLLMTDRRLILVQGLRVKKVTPIPLAALTDLEYKRPRLGNLLGYGRFVLDRCSGVPAGMRTISYVPKPDLLYLDLCDLLFAPPAEPADSSTDQQPCRHQRRDLTE